VQREQGPAVGPEQQGPAEMLVTTAGTTRMAAGAGGTDGSEECAVAPPTAGMTWRGRQRRRCSGDEVEWQAAPPPGTNRRSGWLPAAAANGDSEKNKKKKKKLLLHAAADGWEEKPVSHIRDADELTESLIM